MSAALESVVEPLSLEEPVYADGGDAVYVIDQVRDPDGEDSWISGLQFRQTVAGLTPREKRIMELRYLKGKTQMEVAREIGISQAQVSRLETAAQEQFHQMTWQSGGAWTPPRLCVRWTCCSRRPAPPPARWPHAPRCTLPAAAPAVPDHLS